MQAMPNIFIKFKYQKSITSNMSKEDWKYKYIY